MMDLLFSVTRKNSDVQYKGTLMRILQNIVICYHWKKNCIIYVSNINIVAVLYKKCVQYIQKIYYP